MDDVTLGDRLYTVEQIRKIESHATKLQFNNDNFVLMQRAGHVAYHKILKLYRRIKYFNIYCGQGNNGGDGFIVAALAIKDGYKVQVFFLGNESSLSENGHKAYKEFQKIIQDNKNGKLIHCLAEYDFIDSVESFKAVDFEHSIYVDALLGIGVSRAPEGSYKKAIEFINTKKNIFAIDVPSGLNADTGEIYGMCVKATHTQTFIAFKPGLFTGDGPDYCGAIYLDSLTIDSKILTTIGYSSWLINKDYSKNIITEYLPRRSKNSHKHQFGHVLIIGGGPGMPGAVIMAGLAAMRTGAGLVTIITHRDHGHEITNAQPELMTYGVDENFVTELAAKDEIAELINKATVIVVGPGLGQSAWAKKLFNHIMMQILHQGQKKSLLIDADGSTLLSELITQKEYLNLLQTGSVDLILTPHPGEARKLLQNIHLAQENIVEEKQSRFRIATSISEGYNAITVLKGKGTLVAAPNFKTALCPYGNPGMSTAGAGDILAGVIAGLIAQKLENYIATCLGVYIHAVAGDLQAKKYGERGLIATDLLQEIRQLLNS